MAARLAPQGVPPLAHDEGAALAQRHLSAHRLPVAVVLLGAQVRDAAAVARRRRSRAAAHVREARHSAQRAEVPVRRRRRRDLRLGERRHDDEEGARRARHRLLLARRGGARASRARAEVPRLRRALLRQLLRRAQLGGVLRRLVRLRPEGRALSDGALDLLPHQRGRHGTVRAHAHRRRRRARTSATSRAARRRSARRASCMRPSSSSSR